MSEAIALYIFFAILGALTAFVIVGKRKKKSEEK